jgi:hypothetical protein
MRKTMKAGMEAQMKRTLTAVIGALCLFGAACGGGGAGDGSNGAQADNGTGSDNGTPAAPGTRSSAYWWNELSTPDEQERTDVIVGDVTVGGGPQSVDYSPWSPDDNSGIPARFRALHLMGAGGASVRITAQGDQSSRSLATGLSIGLYLVSVQQTDDGLVFSEIAPDSLEGELTNQTTLTASNLPDGMDVLVVVREANNQPATFNISADQQ